MDRKWLGNGWGISNLCAPSWGIPGRGLFLLLEPLFIKNVLLVVSIINLRFYNKKGPTAGASLGC